MPPMDSGVYQISIGPWFYFGQSQDMRSRWSKHLADLRSGRHTNTIMQRAYVKYKVFDAIVSKSCDIPDLDREEQRLLDAFHGTENCMNIAKCAEAPGRGMKHGPMSEDAKLKMSATCARKLEKKEARKVLWTLPAYLFEHKDGRVESQTPYDMRRMYKMSRFELVRLVRGSRNILNGWRCKGPA